MIVCCRVDVVGWQRRHETYDRSRSVFVIDFSVNSTTPCLRVSTCWFRSIPTIDQRFQFEDQSAVQSVQGSPDRSQHRCSYKYTNTSFITESTSASSRHLNPSQAKLKSDRKNYIDFCKMWRSTLSLTPHLPRDSRLPCLRSRAKM